METIYITHAGRVTVGTVVNLVKWLKRLLLQKLDEIPEIRLLTYKLGTQNFWSVVKMFVQNRFSDGNWPES